MIAAAGDGPIHTRAVAERLAGLTGAQASGEGFPQTPRPAFAAAREAVQAALLGLLDDMRQRAARLTSGGAGARTW